MLDKYHKKESPILGIAGMGGGTSSRLFGAVAFIDPPTITSPSASSNVGYIRPAYVRYRHQTRRANWYRMMYNSIALASTDSTIRQSL